MADIVYIRTAQDFVDLINGVYGRGTSSAYLNVEITDDIDMNDLGDPYEFVATNTSGWYIYLNGNHHTISNIYYSNAASNARWTLFYTLNGSSEIKNLIFKDVFVNAYYITFIGSNRNGTLTNVEIYGTLQAYGESSIIQAYFIYNSVINGTFTHVVNGYYGIVARYIANCTAIVNSATTDFHIYYPDNALTTSFAMINGGRNITVWNNNNASLCYFVPYAATGTVTSGGGTSVVYDAEIAAANNVTVTGSATAETTANLHNAEYMATTYGFPY